MFLRYPFVSLITFDPEMAFVNIPPSNSAFMSGTREISFYLGVLADADFQLP